MVLCIDAAYHSPLNSFLDSIHGVLNSKGRVGFHYLMWSEKWQNLSKFEQEKYRLLLKTVDIQIENLHSQADLQQMMQQHQFDHIQIDDLSEPVFLGFARYIAQQKKSRKYDHFLDVFKIKMTAKLCNKLYRDGLVRYIQITAQNMQ